MTRELLHNDPTFRKLFEDPRFIGALMFLRNNVAPRHVSASATDQMLFKAGMVEGWQACVDALAGLSEPPQPTLRESAPRPAYTTSESK